MAKYPKTLGRIEAVWNKLGGEEGVDRFLANELIVVERNGNVPVVPVASGILRLISGAETLTLEPTDGKGMIGTARETFPGGIDGDFQNWGCNVESAPTGAAKVVVHEMCKDGTFQQMFGGLSDNLDQLYFTQDQIIQFCRKYQNWLHPEGWATFFPFKVGERLLVAHVCRRGGQPQVNVYQLARGYVWGAEHRNRVVVLQLTPASSGA